MLIIQVGETQCHKCAATQGSLSGDVGVSVLSAGHWGCLTLRSEHGPLLWNLTLLFFFFFFPVQVGLEVGGHMVYDGYVRIPD